MEEGGSGGGVGGGGREGGRRAGDREELVRYNAQSLPDPQILYKALL